ncbi:MAG: M14 family zinc carboxypeptidase [Anaerolineales bacterium]|nr:M14 family zinc carboxypeptidase [Anaerolineales bacterium]
MRRAANETRRNETRHGASLLALCAFGLAACTSATFADPEPLPTLAATLPDPGTPHFVFPTLPPEWTSTPYLSPTPTNTRPPSPTPTDTRTPLPSWTPKPKPTLTFTPPPGNVTIIGYSLGGRPLEVYTFGNGPVEKLIIAGIHGGYEWNTVKLADELITYLNANPAFIPPDVTLYIVRVVNPDGYARARGVDGQMNDRGVDLNRNWPSNWMPDWPRSGCWTYRPVTGGAYPLSEPETRALADFILQHNFEASISYHSAALGIFAGGYADDRPSLRLAEALAAVTTYPFPPIDTGCYYTGQFSDWAAEQGIAAVDVELTNHRDTDFEMNLRLLEVFLRWRR